MHWGDEAYGDARVDAALDALTKEWSSPKVLATYCTPAEEEESPHWRPTITNATLGASSTGTGNGVGGTFGDSQQRITDSPQRFSRRSSAVGSSTGSLSSAVPPEQHQRRTPNDCVLRDCGNRQEPSGKKRVVAKTPTKGGTPSRQRSKPSRVPTGDRTPNGTSTARTDVASSSTGTRTPKVRRGQVRNPSSGPCVEDRLLERHHLTEAKLLAAREEKEMKEMTTVRAAPQMSTGSARLIRKAGDHRVPLYARNYSPKRAPPEEPGGDNGAPENKEKVRAVEWKPRINDRSKNLVRGVEAQKAWAHSRQEHIDAMKNALVRLQKEEETGQPAINPISRALAQNRESQEGLERLDIGDRLLVKDAHSRAKFLQEQTDQEHQTRIRTSRGHPATSNDPTEVSNRLFLEAQDRAQRQAAERQRRELLDCVDPKTGQVLGHPLVAPPETIPNVTKYQYVETLGIDELAKPRDRRATTLPAGGATTSHSSPAIGEYSRFLAELKQTREPGVSTLDRLTAPRKEVSTAVVGTFSPSINERSARLDAVKNAADGRSRVDLLFERQHQYETHRLRLQAARVAQEEAEMSVRERQSAPTINQSNTDGSTSQIRSFVTRMDAWNERRDIKLSKQRQEKDVAAATQCTFQPTTRARTPVAGGSSRWNLSASHRSSPRKRAFGYHDLHQQSSSSSVAPPPPVPTASIRRPSPSVVGVDYYEESEHHREGAKPPIAHISLVACSPNLKTKATIR